MNNLKHGNALWQKHFRFPPFKEPECYFAFSHITAGFKGGSSIDFLHICCALQIFLLICAVFCSLWAGILIVFDFKHFHESCCQLHLAVPITIHKPPQGN